MEDGLGPSCMRSMRKATTVSTADLRSLYSALGTIPITLHSFGNNAAVKEVTLSDLALPEDRGIIATAKLRCTMPLESGDCLHYHHRDGEYFQRTRLRGTEQWTSPSLTILTT